MERDADVLRIFKRYLHGARPLIGFVFHRSCCWAGRHGSSVDRNVPCGSPWFLVERNPSDCHHGWTPSQSQTLHLVLCCLVHFRPRNCLTLRGCCVRKHQIAWGQLPLGGQIPGWKLKENVEVGSLQASLAGDVLNLICRCHLRKLCRCYCIALRNCLLLDRCFVALHVLKQMVSMFASLDWN